MAKIAAALQNALDRRRIRGEPGGTAARVLARGNGWSVADVVCTSGPGDRPFEERHTNYSIAVVVAGSFQYRSRSGDALMTPGSLMLGNAGQCFECGHEHADGDRCVSFQYAPEYFERLLADVGHRGLAGFAAPRIPPVRALAPLVALAGAGVENSGDVAWNELALELAAHALDVGFDRRGAYRAPRNAEARATRTVRAIERHLTAPLSLDTLAHDAGLSPYHFLRTFQRLTGITPHQYILRSRLREAAMRFSAGRGRVLDVALECGFGDLSNFNRSFRAEFGQTPREYRLKP